MTAATLRPLTVDDLPVVLATDTRGAELDGRLVGAVWTYHLPSEVREERCYVFGRVEPAVRGRGSPDRAVARRR